MHHNIASLTHGDIVFEATQATEPFLPAVIPCSDVYMATGPYGQLLFQPMPAQTFHLHYHVYRLRQPLINRHNDTLPVVQMIIAWQRNLRLLKGNLVLADLKEGQFNIMYAPPMKVTAHFNSAAEYSFICIDLTPEVLKEYADYTTVTSFLQKIAMQQTALLFDEHRWLGVEMSNFLAVLLRCNFPQPICEQYCNLKLQQVFLLMAEPLQEANKLTQQEMEICYKTRFYLKRNTNQQISIPQLAKQAGIGEFKLRSIFKQAFGTSLFQYMAEVKMKHAYQLLEHTNIPIKLIAEMVGYNSVSAFTTAFKKYFRWGPRALRNHSSRHL